MISVKANQHKLHEQLHQQSQSEAVFSVHLDHERTRDRQTSRIATVFELPPEVKALWQGAQQGVEVTRFGTRGGEAQVEQQYYITSWQASAQDLQARIRAHWGIENPLHWVKDVVLGEDHTSIASNSAAALMALIRNLVITLFRRAGHHSITAAIDRWSNDLDHLLPMVEFPSG